MGETPEVKTEEREEEEREGQRYDKRGDGRGHATRKRKETEVINRRRMGRRRSWVRGDGKMKKKTIFRSSSSSFSRHIQEEEKQGGERKGLEDG